MQILMIFFKINKRVLDRYLNFVYLRITRIHENFLSNEETKESKVVEALDEGLT